MIVGHESIVQTLFGLSRKERLHHAYVFWGTENVGKRTSAESLLRRIESDFVDEKTAGAVPIDSITVGAEGGTSVGISSARRIRSYLAQAPLAARYKSVIIDDAHTMTREAQHALLKITEDAHPSSLLIFISRDKESLAPALLSRMHAVFFSTVPEKDIARWLTDEMGMGAADSERAAKRAFGRPGRAYNLLNDESYRNTDAWAEEYVRHRGSKRAFIKEITQDENFRAGEFLDAVIAWLAEEKLYTPWHAVLELRHTIAYYNLNTRLQLEALAEYLE